MPIFISLLPILLFVFLYLGCGIYFVIQGVANPFFQVSPTIAIIPAISLGWIINQGSNQQRMDTFLRGIGQETIIMMCIIFLLAGAFSSVSSAIGCVDSVVNLVLSITPHGYLLTGIFILSAIVSTAIGTSMGTIATIAPIAAGLSNQGAFLGEIGLATVVGGAMFGDNLSLISDTTIASVVSQNANFKKKLYINSKVALIAAIITCLILLIGHESQLEIEPKEYSINLILPYLFLLLLAVSGINIFLVLVFSTIFAGIIGYFNLGYTLLEFSKHIDNGFKSMYEVVLLTLLIGGLSGLIKQKTRELGNYLSDIIVKYNSRKIAQLLIVKIVSIFDLLIANNTLAILLSGEMAQNISKKYKIPSHYSAAWLDIFSCVFQGLIPYGPQILLASTIGEISPLSISPHVYYCYVLGGIALLFILFQNRLKL